MRSVIHSIRIGAIGLCMLSAVASAPATARAEGVSAPPRRETKLHSPAMVAMGSVLMGIFLTAGIGFTVAAEEADKPRSSCSGSFCLPSGDWGFGAGALQIAGVISFGHALGLGLPLIIIGAQQKPVTSTPPPPPLATIQLGPASARVTW